MIDNVAVLFGCVLVVYVIFRAARLDRADRSGGRR